MGHRSPVMPLDMGQEDAGEDTRAPRSREGSVGCLAARTRPRAQVARVLVPYAPQASTALA